MTTVSLAAVREAADQERQRAVEISEACNEAGQAARIEGYIRSGLSVREVKRELAKLAPSGALAPKHIAAFDPAAIEAALAAEKRVLH